MPVYWVTIKTTATALFSVFAENPELAEYEIRSGHGKELGSALATQGLEVLEIREEPKGREE